MPVFQIVVPIVAAIVGACIALSSVSLNQWLNRRATRDQWLREKRARVYADLVDSVDNLVSVVFLLANALIDHQIVDGDDMQRYNVASANFRRACSVTDLYAPQEIRDLVHAADAEYVSAVMSNKPDCYSKGLDALEKIRPQLVELARKELQSL